jgi:hypothetical protein
MNEASHRPTPTQIKTSTTSHTVFMDSSAKGVYAPMIADNEQTDKLFKFGWVQTHCTNEHGEAAERQFAVKLQRVDRHITGNYKFGTAVGKEVAWYR